MATLNNPIEEQNLIDRFADYVTATANSGIVWGSNAPGPSYTDVNGTTYSAFSAGSNSAANSIGVALFGGTTSGPAISISGSSITGDPINAGTIRTTLENETALYTNVRKLRVQITIDGGGGNTGTRRSTGVVIDDTQVAHMATSYRQSLGTVSTNQVVSGAQITVSGLQGYFSNLQSAYNTARNNVHTYTATVCHASCHSSCHGSRGRR